MFWENGFSIVFHTKVWENKFDPGVERSKIILGSYLKKKNKKKNLTDLESLKLYTKIQPQSFLGSGVEDFKCFYHNMAAILLNGPWPFV